MTLTEKLDWAKRAFAEIARDCEEISVMPMVGTAESNTWKSIAATARRNIKILEQK